MLADFFSLNPVALLVCAGIFGLIVGSFLNVVIYRVPVMMEREEQAWVNAHTAADDPEVTISEAPALETFNLLQPPSACPHCQAPVRAQQNIPVISYLLLKGRCAGCQNKISARYPAIELLTGVLSVLVVWRFGFSPASAGGLLLTWSLIALTFIDLDHQLLPDRITLPLVWLGLIFSLLSGAAGGTVLTDPRSAIIGAVAGYLILWTVYQGFKLVTGKEGMGYGDFKLLAALGAWLGWQLLPIIILLSAVVGLVGALALIVFQDHDRRVPIPFGPYLAAAGFIALIWGQELLTLWLGSPAGR